MRQLSDILIERKSNFGGWAEIGRLLGGIDGQLIGKYAAGKVVPAFDFAIKWKIAFNENLIDLMFESEKPGIVSEPQPEYSDLRHDLIDCQQKLIACYEEKQRLQRALDESTNNKP